jgi:thioredoxin 1
MSHIVTSADFEEKVLNSKGVVLVDFWAEWCPPCRALTPLLEQVAEEAKDKATLYKLNTDENQDIAMNYHIVSIPTVKFFKDGKEVENIVGLQQKGVYHGLIDKHSK